jgi:hypothetical protein
MTQPARALSAVALSTARDDFIDGIEFRLPRADATSSSDEVVIFIGVAFPSEVQILFRVLGI